MQYHLCLYLNVCIANLKNMVPRCFYKKCLDFLNLRDKNLMGIEKHINNIMKIIKYII